METRSKLSKSLDEVSKIKSISSLTRVKDVEKVLARALEIIDRSRKIFRENE